MPDKPNKEEILALMEAYEGNTLEKIINIDVKSIPMIYHLEGVVWFNEEEGIAKIPCENDEEGRPSVTEEFGFIVELPTLFASSGEIETFGALIFEHDDDDVCEIIEKITTRIGAKQLKSLPRKSQKKVILTDPAEKISSNSGKRLIIFPEKMVWRDGVQAHNSLPNKSQSTLYDTEGDELATGEKIESIKNRSAMYFNGKLVNMLFICGPSEQYDVAPQINAETDG